MIPETIIVAIIALVGTLAGSFLSSNKIQTLLDYRLGELEKKVEKHNQLVERVTVLERDTKTAFNRIDEIREEVKEIKKGA